MNSPGGPLATAVALFKSPPKLTVSQWADRERRLSSESSAEPGQWRTDRAPFQRAIMDAVADPTIREIVVMKSAQVGWTEILLNVVGYFVDLDPSPILMVQPTVEMGQAFSKDRLAPMVRDTPALTGKIADARSRDSGNTTLHKTFPGGHITIGGANSPAGLASRPIRVALFDEVDRFPASAGTEGDPVALGKKRTTTFWNRKILMGSTPTIKGESRIESAFEQGDQRYYMVPCPHCNERQRLVWAQVRWDEGLPETAHYVCQHCGTMLNDSDKLQMLREGDFVATKQANGIASFHISELYSPWVTWAEMARSFLEGKKLPETLQTWINTSLGETWEDRGETLEPQGLLARRESYTANSLPTGVLLLTAGTDVQDDRLEHTVWGWGRDEECFRVSHTVLKGDPGANALWAEHDELLKKRFRTDDGRELVVEACAVDSGGHHTQRVYEYCARRKKFRVWAIKGVAGQGRLVWPRKASRAGKSSADLYPIGVDTIKDLIYGRLKRVAQPGPGYIHFDATSDEATAEQITSETMVYRYVQGRRVRMWKPRSTSARNEQLDTFVYAYAAMIGRGGPSVVDRRETFHVEQPVVDVPPLTQSEQFRRGPVRQPMRRTSWATGWK
jgi:phage terminase large subunit GpA-like protein